jgi:hypothetical protein
MNRAARRRNWASRACGPDPGARFVRSAGRRLWQDTRRASDEAERAEPAALPYRPVFPDPSRAS